MAKFAANNHVNTSTGVTPFFADHSFHSQTGIKPPKTYKRGEQQAKLLAVDKIIAQQAKMITFLQDQLAWFQNEQTQFANRTCQAHPKYKIGDKVYVGARHFASERDKKLLDLKNTEPWKIVRNINNKAYELAISETLKDAGLRLIFHPWKMHFAPNNLFPGQILPPGLPIKISAKNDNNEAYEEWKVLEVVDCQQIKQYRVQYKATYIGNWDKWNAAPLWQLWTDFKGSRDKVYKFHHIHP